MVIQRKWSSMVFAVLLVGLNTIQTRHTKYNDILILKRMDIPQRELLRTNHNKTAPLRSPSHVGCAFSIDRIFFFEIGSYDEGMDIWGSENVELAFRVRKSASNYFVH